MNSAWCIVVAVGLALWLAASVLHQFRWEWWTRLAACDLLHLLPRWTFFAPNPGCSDIHLVVRSWQRDKPGAWRPLHLPYDARWHWWLWNPSRFSRKAVMDLVNELRQARSTAGETPRAVLLSRGYICLLRWVIFNQHAPRDEEGRGRDAAGRDTAGHLQFAVVLSHGFEAGRKLELDLISDVHPACA